VGNRRSRRRTQKEHSKSLKNYSDNLEEVALNQYERKPDNLVKAYVSKKYLVQLYQEDNKPLRISIIRNKININMKWEDGITWEEIQDVKNEIGFKDKDCVEIYPARENVVNVANMRHVWVMDELLPFSWKKNSRLPE
jgi:hypothetical protein